MPLKFLRLPHLIQSEIMDNLLPEDIFLLSLCSQKSFKVLQSNFRKFAKLNITVNISTSICIGYYLNGRKGQCVQCSGEPWNDSAFFAEVIKIGGRKMPIQQNVWENTWDIYWGHDQMNVKLVIDHILSLFRRNIHYVKLYGEPQNPREEYSIGVKVGDPLLWNEPPPLQAPNSLQIDLDLSEIVSWDTVDHLDSNVSIPTDLLKVRKTVWLKDSQFVTLDDLMSMNQIEIYMDDSEMTNEDINQFLKNWMWKNGNSRLSVFYCQLKELANWRIICEGMSTLEHDWEDYKFDREKYTSLRCAGFLTLPTRAYFGFRSEFELVRIDGGTLEGKCDDDRITLHFHSPIPGFELQHNTDGEYW